MQPDYDCTFSSFRYFRRLKERSHQLPGTRDVAWRSTTGSCQFCFCRMAIERPTDVSGRLQTSNSSKVRRCVFLLLRANCENASARSNPEWDVSLLWTDLFSLFIFGIFFSRADKRRPAVKTTLTSKNQREGGCSFRSDWRLVTENKSIEWEMGRQLSRFHLQWASNQEKATESF